MGRGSTLTGLTPIGRVTISVLGINLPAALRVRSELGRGRTVSPGHLKGGAPLRATMSPRSSTDFRPPTLINERNKPEPRISQPRMKHGWNTDKKVGQLPQP